jgi:hypothetical protein
VNVDGGSAGHKHADKRISDEAMTAVSPITNDAESVKVPLFYGGVIAGYTLIDVGDAPDVLPKRWLKRHASGYAFRVEHRRGKQTLTYLHRQLLGLEQGDPRRVDHINHDPLDNRRQNLRIVNHFQSAANTRGQRLNPYYRGVHFVKRTGKWAVECTIGGHRMFLGLYADPMVAEQVSSAVHRGLLRLPEAALASIMAKCQVDRVGSSDDN